MLTIDNLFLKIGHCISQLPLRRIVLYLSVLDFISNFCFVAKKLTKLVFRDYHPNSSSDIFYLHEYGSSIGESCVFFLCLYASSDFSVVLF